MPSSYDLSSSSFFRYCDARHQLPALKTEAEAARYAPLLYHSRLLQSRHCCFCSEMIVHLQGTRLITSFVSLRYFRQKILSDANQLLTTEIQSHQRMIIYIYISILQRNLEPIVMIFGTSDVSACIVFRSASSESRVSLARIE